MTDETFDDGLLNQDDINAALEAAGLGEHTVKGESDTPKPSSAGREKANTAAGNPSAAGKSKPAPRNRAAADEDADNAGSRPSGDQRVDSAGRPFDEVAAAMAEAIAAESSASGASPKSAAAANPRDTAPVPMDIPSLEDMSGPGGEAQSIDLLRDVNLDVKIELGRSRMYVEDVLRLNEGSVVELDKLAGDPVDVLVNGRLVARGEVLVLNDTFCVRINDIVSRLPSEEVTV